MTEAQKTGPSAVLALADAWASIDGKLEAFRRERDDQSLRYDSPGFTGHYVGYLADAEEMIKRLKKRGYDVREVEAAQVEATG